MTPRPLRQPVEGLRSERRTIRVPCRSGIRDPLGSRILHSSIPGSGLAYSIWAPATDGRRSLISFRNNHRWWQMLPCGHVAMLHSLQTLNPSLDRVSIPDSSSKLTLVRRHFSYSSSSLDSPSLVLGPYHTLIAK